MRILIGFTTIILFFQMLSCTPSNQCSSPNDCSAGECCVLGMNRFSIPQCKTLGTLGNWCRAENRAENKTLHYPDGSVLNVFDVHTLFCPCSKNFRCKDSHCIKR